MMTKMIAIPRETYEKMLESYDRVVEELETLKQQLETSRHENTPE